MSKNATVEAQADLLGDKPQAKPAETKKPAPKAKAKAEPKAVTKAKPEKSTALVVHDPQPQSGSLLAVISRAVTDKRVDPEKMRQLLDMHKEITAEEARLAFNEAFIDLQGELPMITQTGKIIILEKGTKKIVQATPYATFNEINRVTKPILQKHGFGLSFSTEPGLDGRINVKGILKHRRGHQETTVFPLPLETSGSKNNVQGVGSSMSYGKRYAAIALLNLVSEAPQDNDDKDGNLIEGKAERTQGFEPDPTTTTKHAGVITTDEHDKLIDAIEDCGIDRQRVLTKYGIAKIADLPADLYQDAMSACAKYKAARPT